MFLATELRAPAPDACPAFSFAAVLRYFCAFICQLAFCFSEVNLSQGYIMVRFIASQVKLGELFCHGLHALRSTAAVELGWWGVVSDLT